MKQLIKPGFWLRAPAGPSHILDIVGLTTAYNIIIMNPEAQNPETTSGKDTIDVKVENNKGTTLPSTGGMGTTMFYIVGAVLVIGAGVLLVTRRRMSAQ